MTEGEGAPGGSRSYATGGWIPTPTDTTASRPKVAIHPGRVMRALLGVREVALIVALILASILMVLMLAGLGSILNGISDATTPDPVPTECFEGVPC